MKKHILLLFLLFPIFSCFKGYSTKDAKILKPYLNAKKLKELTDAPDDTIWIIDVRPYSAFKKGHIPTAKSFPSSVILSRLDELPKDKNLILYCETGGRAQAVIKMLTKEGYKKLMNWGSYKRWPYKFDTE